MARLADLNLRAEAVEPAGSFDDLPDPYQPRVPILQPGWYRFQLPKDLSNVSRGRVAQVAYQDEQGHEQRRSVERIVVVLKERPLIIRASPGGLRDGESFRWQVSSIERWRDKAHTQRASDLDYLLLALGETELPGFENSAGYIDALMTHGGESFAASVDIWWFCSDRREIYMRDEHGRIVKVPGVFGTGRRYSTRKIPRDEHGNYPETIELSITAKDSHTGKRVKYTAVVRGYNELSKFRP